MRLNHAFRVTLVEFIATQWLNGTCFDFLSKGDVRPRMEVQCVLIKYLAHLTHQILSCIYLVFFSMICISVCGPCDHLSYYPFPLLRFVDNKLLTNVIVILTKECHDKLNSGIIN